MDTYTQPTVQPDAHHAAVAEQLRARDTHERTHNRLAAAGLGIVAVGMVVASVYAESHGLDSAHLRYALPLAEKAQDITTHIDDGLVPIGMYGLPLAVTLVAAVKALAPHSNRASFADSFSAREPNAEVGRDRSRWFGLRRKVGMALAGAALATFTASLATEVSSGPDRPLDAFEQLVPGDAMITQYAGTMPMVESNLNSDLQAEIEQEAAARGIVTHDFGLNLGSYTYKGKTYTALMAGVQTPESSPLHWNGASCTDIPVMLDSASGVEKGEVVTYNGIPVRVVQTTENTSSMQRVSGVMDLKALKTCVEQNADAPSYGVSLETNAAAANDILASARAELGTDAPAAVITPAEQKQNSEAFWDKNVKPLTGILSLAAMGISVMATANVMGSRLLRNRRELGARLAAGVSHRTLWLAELVRATKDGIVAGVGGAIVGLPLSLVPNAIQQGFDAGAGIREMSVGVAVGLVGAIGGAVIKLTRLKSVANPTETTRV